MNLIKEKLGRDEPALGTMIYTGSIETAELMGLIGFDFVVIDSEHGATGFETMRRQIISIEAGGSVPIVRPHEKTIMCIKQALDSGAKGLFCQNVCTREEAEFIVDSSKYPPEGHRGIGLSRGSKYGLDAGDYVKHSNDDIFLMMMIESPEGVEGLPEILEVKGLDAIMIGPSDLSGSYGHYGDLNHPDVKDAIDTIVNTCRKKGVDFGIHVRDVDTALRFREMGSRLLMVGGDIPFIRQQGVQALDGLRR